MTETVRLLARRAAAVLLLVAALARPDASAGEPETVRFGVCLSLSGRFGGYGKVDLAGIKLRLAEFNADAEETGVRLEMLVRDDESNPAKGAAIVDELAEREGVQAIIGPIETTIMEAMEERARARKVVLISPTVTGESGHAGDAWVFKLLFTDEQQGVALAKFARAELGAETAAAMINDHFDYGDAVFGPFQDEFTAGGGRITSVERYGWGLAEKETPNFINLLDNVKLGKPDVVLIPGFSEDAIAIIRQSLLVNIKTTFLGGDAWFTPDLLLAAGNNVEGACYASATDFSEDNGNMRHFLDLYENSNDPDASLASVDAYDALSVLIEALKRGRSGEEIREGLYALDHFPLSSGTITFDKEKGNLRTLFVHRVVKRGEDFVFETAARLEP